MKCTSSVALLVVALLAWGHTVHAQTQVPKKPAIEGWDKARFGMTQDEVQRLYPDAEMGFNIITSRECWSKAKPNEEPYPILLSAWAEKGLGPFACDMLKIADFKFGEAPVSVDFLFSQRTGRLAKIAIRPTNKSESTYDAYRQGLQNRYGRGNETVIDAREDECNELRRKDAAGETYYGASLNRVSVRRHWSHEADGRLILLRLSQVHLCTGLTAFPVDMQQKLLRDFSSLDLIFEDTNLTKPVVPKF